MKSSSSMTFTDMQQARILDMIFWHVFCSFPLVNGENRFKNRDCANCNRMNP